MNPTDRNTMIEVGILGLFGYLLFFNSTNVNPTLAFVYTILLVVSFAFIFADRKRQIPLVNKNISFAKMLLYSAGAYIILILVSSQLGGLIASFLPISEILGLLGASAPVFSGSALFNFLNFAVLIPYLETFAIFVIAIDFFSDVFNIRLDRVNIKLTLMIVIISIAFLFFHIQAKGIANEILLIQVFLMALISCILVLITKEGRTAIVFHVIANTVGLLS